MHRESGDLRGTIATFILAGKSATAGKRPILILTETKQDDVSDAG